MYIYIYIYIYIYEIRNKEYWKVVSKHYTKQALLRNYFNPFSSQFNIHIIWSYLVLVTVNFCIWLY